MPQDGASSGEPPRPAGDAWRERGGAYAASEVHRAGPTLAALLALAAPRPGDVALDVGTGAGHTAAALAAAGADTTGVDPSGAMLGAARSEYGERPRLRFAHGRGDALPARSGSVDLVVARHTLHHHPDVRATLREIARVLRPGGRFAWVDEANPGPRLSAWFERLERTRDPSHVRTHTPGGWRRLVAAAGLRWVAGDAATRTPLDAATWIARTAPEAATAECRALLRNAPRAARERFAIRYAEDGDAVAFALPMVVALAVRPEEPPPVPRGRDGAPSSGTTD